jgi:hypothetical protein
MKFAERSAPDVVNRSHFLAVAARAMRHVVVDYVRSRQSHNRNPGAAVITLDGEAALTDTTSPLDLIAMNEACAARKA